MAVRHFTPGGIYIRRDIFFNIPHGKRPGKQACILVFLYFVFSCNVSAINYVAVIKTCSETLFSKKSYYIETGQLICKTINWLVYIWYEFLLKGISEQTIQVLFDDMLILQKRSNIDPLKISCRLTLPFRLNSSRRNALYRVGCCKLLCIF